jgi:hypothetical protein
VSAIEAEVSPAPDGLYRLCYRVFGDADKLRIPPHGSPNRANDLWRHTCFECFVAGNGTDYREFNFSPSTQWAAYRFESYRRGMKELDPVSHPRISFTLMPGAFFLDAVVDLSGFVARDAPGPRMALAAIIEDVDGATSYWALAHPPGKPDFHHADGFVGALAHNVN